MDIKSTWIRAGQIAAQNVKQSEQVFDALHESLDFVGHFDSIEKKSGSLICTSHKGNLEIDLNASAGAVTIRGGDNKINTVEFRDAGYDAVPKILVAIKGIDQSFGQTFNLVIAEIEDSRPAYVLT